MVVFPDTMYTFRDTRGGGGGSKLIFFLISNFCHSIQLIQILHSLIQRGGGGGGGKGTGPPGKTQVIWDSIGNKQLDLPLEKLYPPPPPPWKKC